MEPSKGSLNASLAFDKGTPSLFLIAMEIFSACLKNFTDKPEFLYHWRTEYIKLTYLIFAYDVLMFSKGDVSSVKAMLEGVTYFSSI